MVVRTFSARDNEALVVDSSSPYMADGSPVINNSDTPVGTIFIYEGGWPLETISVNDDGGDEDVLEDDDPDSHIIVDGGTLVETGMGIEAESFHTFRELDGSGNPFGPEITIAVYSQNGETSNVWGFVSFAPLSHGTRYVKISGSSSGTQPYEDLMPCFTSGTRIKTPDGYKVVEELDVGDIVWAQGNETARVIWASCSMISDKKKDAPIIFPIGTVGNDAELIVSPQHRIMLEKTQFPNLWHTDQVFVPAKYFVGHMGVTQARCDKTRYFHILLEKHDVLESNGAKTESFYPGAQVMRSFSQKVQLGLVNAIRSVHAKHAADYGPLALPCLNRAQAEILLSRTFAKAV